MRLNESVLPAQGKTQKPIHISFCFLVLQTMLSMNRLSESAAHQRQTAEPTVYLLVSVIAAAVVLSSYCISPQTLKNNILDEIKHWLFFTPAPTFSNEEAHCLQLSSVD